MFVESIKKELNRAAMMLAAPLHMSRLTARIMAIMVFPLSIFVVGLLSIDQYIHRGGLAVVISPVTLHPEFLEQQGGQDFRCSKLKTVSCGQDFVIHDY